MQRWWVSKTDHQASWPGSWNTAVHPQNQSQGIPDAFVNRANTELTPQFSFRYFRIFDIRKINDRVISGENTRSKNAFVNASTRHFAHIEEEIVLNNATTLLVRWNYWLKEFKFTSAPKRSLAFSFPGIILDEGGYRLLFNVLEQQHQQGVPSIRDNKKSPGDHSTRAFIIYILESSFESTDPSAP